MTDSQSTSRTRRIVRRAVMALVVAVLLISSYVSNWFLMFWLVGRGTITTGTSVDFQGTVFAPVVVYGQSDLPGSDWLMEGAQNAYARGVNHR